MKANEIKFSRFLAQTDTQFVIPVYQRNYEWKEQQCSQLLDDIMAVGVDETQYAHFIGSIVYIHDDVYSLSGIRDLTIIDGQQRITTLTLIYIVIYALAHENNSESLKNRINETYLINKFADEEEKLKLKPTDNNDKALKYLLRNDVNEDYAEYSQLVENYNYFKKRIILDNLETVRKGLGKLLFVEISLEKGKDDPQRIFESLNSTGLELSQADLIRNYILIGLNRKHQRQIFHDYWLPIEQYTTEEKNQTKQVSEFIKDFLIIEHRELPHNDRVYDVFKKKYPMHDFENIKQLLSRLKRFASYYHKLLNPRHEPDIDIREQFRFMTQLEMSDAYPFLLEIYHDYTEQKIKKTILIDILETVQSFIWRRFIAGLPRSALNSIFMRLHEEIDPSNYRDSLQRFLVMRKGNQRFPGDPEVINILQEKDMYNIRGKSRRYFLERLENYQNPEKVLIENNPHITIEHIFPQNPNIIWKKELGAEMCQRIKEKYVNTIANLTLSGNNGELGNRSFQEKRDMNVDEKEQGYQFSRLWLNRLLTSREHWDEVSIEERFHVIVERFKHIWKYPSLELEEDSGYDEINIFDAEEPNERKLLYIILFGQKLVIKRMSRLYVHVIKKLFDLQPQTFFSTDLAEELHVSKNKNVLKVPVQLNETYYMDVAHLDDNKKFEQMKYALSTFEFEEELFIKYIDE